jgi:ribonuclease P protein component
MQEGGKHRFSFPICARIRDTNRFRQIFDNGQCLRGRSLVLWWIQGDPGNWRLGVVASKRTFPRAVDRARAKRLIREAFRLQRAEWSSGGDLVIVARRAILRMNCQSVAEELTRIVGKLRKPGGGK